MKQNRIIWVLSGVIIVLALVLVGVFVFLRNQPPPRRGPVALAPIAPLEKNAAVVAR